MSNGPVGVAIVGAGVISGQYLRNLNAFPDVRVVAVADLDTDRAAAVAREHDVRVSGTLGAVLSLAEVELVVNLTIPAAHAAVALESLRAGKHVYGEKPLAMDLDEAAKVMAEAEQRGLRVGGAPDTFLGAGLQSAVHALRAGAVGEPVAVTAATQSLGPESWHPSPEFLYARGGGPLFDLGPYYLTALVSMLGPVTRVAAGTRKAREQRVIGSGPKAGTLFPVEVSTHVNALLDFPGSATATATFSFDSAVNRRMIEIIGTEGALSLPDPNTFDGPLLARGPNDLDWRELPLSGTTAGRGIGVLDLARSIRAGTPHRASGELARHVLELMTAITESGERAEFRTVGSTVATPEPLPEGWDPYAATLS
ncbi:Gfo/Idh/MocA family protein [Nonomuraea gerenzanensis]|uniref:NADH-dependent dehydrogenase n=1 Tax=Nonomuraea gerenzanensis TaxID=93944 RepID=A0A1M4DXX8_9ACTN|nr:Gfo/Idh/MocA family oxidoreductase [Nonomuraea gerenzanensis]UBU13746.1 Gfo/Idh/MocA family oxidoreductase [Nonomuraea gerenzanensis]SBO91414.1 NADH-dependent dehydrogenase [Nonomuraea gerenzanensis]